MWMVCKIRIRLLDVSSCASEMFNGRDVTESELFRIRDSLPYLGRWETWGMAVTSEDKPLYLEEIAAKLRCPLRSVRVWVASGRLPSFKPGRRRMVFQRDLEAFLEGARKERA